MQHVGDDRPVLDPIHHETVCEWTPGNSRHDHQFIFELSDDQLLLVWCEYYADAPSYLDRDPTDELGQIRDHMPCRVSGKLSADRGRTWSDSFVLQENRWEGNVKHPNLVRFSPEELLFTFVGWESETRRNVFMKRSEDNGESWGPIEQISSPGWYCNNAGHALQLESGRVLLPAHSPGGGDEFETLGPGIDEVGSENLYSFVYYTDDRGDTWQTSEDAMTVPGRGAHEPSIVELEDGRLLCLLRNSQERIYKAYSEDEGVHWSDPVPTELPAPESPSIVRRIPTTGDLLLLWNNVASDSNWPRRPLTAAISTDEGESWGSFADVDARPDHDAAYADVAFVDGEALVTYYSSPEHWARDAEVTLKIFSIDQFYN
jgi:sialidase-1